MSKTVQAISSATSPTSTFVSPPEAVCRVNRLAMRSPMAQAISLPGTLNLSRDQPWPDAQVALKELTKNFCPH